MKKEEGEKDENKDEQEIEKKQVSHKEDELEDTAA